LGGISLQEGNFLFENLLRNADLCLVYALRFSGITERGRDGLIC